MKIRGSNSPLTWKRIKRRIFPRGLSFTREGKIYVLVTLGVGFAAVNTGNNLMFLVLGLLLGLIIVSGFLSEVSLAGLTVQRHLPDRVEAGMPFPVELTLKNGKSLASSFGVELRDDIDGQPFRRRCFFLRVGPEEERSVAYRCELSKRGRARFDGTTISTRFPFGLFEKSRFVELEDHTIALPKRISLTVPQIGSALGEGGTRISIHGSGADFRELREMVPGDDPRKIHWRSTARLGVPMIRETDAEAAGFLEVVLDPGAEGPSASALAQAERNISAAGTIVRDLTARGLTVRLITSPSASLEASNRAEMLVLLEHLALIDTVRAARSDPPLGRGASSVLIGPRARTVGQARRLTIPVVAHSGLV